MALVVDTFETDSLTEFNFHHIFHDHHGDIF